MRLPPIRWQLRVLPARAALRAVRRRLAQVARAQLQQRRRQLLLPHDLCERFDLSLAEAPVGALLRHVEERVELHVGEVADTHVLGGGGVLRGSERGAGRGDGCVQSSAWTPGGGGAVQGDGCVQSSAWMPGGGAGRGDGCVQSSAWTPGGGGAASAVQAGATDVCRAVHGRR
eukprot:365176-Chlamydomonas_euryale.AAC.1